jgi:hypothetical protein
LARDRIAVFRASASFPETHAYEISIFPSLASSRFQMAL